MQRGHGEIGAGKTGLGHKDSMMKEKEKIGAREENYAW
jgi:hypothetical protein